MGWHCHDGIAELRQPIRDLRQAIPYTWAAFGALDQSAVAPGELRGHVKELIALAVVKQLRCIAYHAKAAAMKGATRQEVAEVRGVALLMDGGTASVYGPRDLAAFDEFAAAVPPAAAVAAAR